MQVQGLQCKHKWSASVAGAQFWVGCGPGQGQLQLAEKGIPEADHRHHCHRHRSCHCGPQFHHCRPDHHHVFLLTLRPRGVPVGDGNDGSDDDNHQENEER